MSTPDVSWSDFLNNTGQSAESEAKKMIAEERGREDDVKEILKKMKGRKSDEPTIDAESIILSLNQEILDAYGLSTKDSSLNKSARAKARALIGKLKPEEIRTTLNWIAKNKTDGVWVYIICDELRKIASETAGS